MKRILSMMLLLFVLLAGTAWAVDQWHTANQRTMAWDAVSPPVNIFEPSSFLGVIRYKVFLQSTDLSGAPVGNPIELAEIDATQYTITFPGQGVFIAGVRSVLILEGQQVGESAIVWSNNPASVQGGVTFGFRYFVVDEAGNLRSVQ